MKLNLIRCKSCPFNEHGCVSTRASVMQKVLSVGSQKCHHTKNQTLCRGARDFQLKMLTATGFLPEATDYAWNEKCRELGIEPNAVKA